MKIMDREGNEFIKTYARVWVVGLAVVCTASLPGVAGPSLAEVERQHIGLASRVAPAVVAILGEPPGSGVIVSRDGHLVTCNDILPAAARTVTVRLFGGRQVQAQIVKRYPWYNVAVLQMPEKGLPWLPMRVETPEVGTLVFTVGNTRGVQNKSDQSAFHAGVVSGLFTPEAEVGAGALKQLLETDAGVNPGSFGGALVDVDGRLRGIVSAYYSERRWWGTAIPVAVFAEEVKRDFGWPAEGGPASDPAPTFLNELQSAFQEAAGRIARCVVTVKADRSASLPQAQTPRAQVEKRYRMVPRAGMASGVIVGADGYVLTASFNVDQADTLSVILPDGRTVGATLVAQDQERDLALLKIGVTGLPEPEWAPRESLRAGHWTVVVGRDRPNEPFTMSTGIVSALDRAHGNAFETDAQVNYGNAGGAVVDVEGRLLGIATRVAAAASHGINSGVAFAAPGALVREGLSKLKEGKTILASRAPFLGIAFRNDEEDIDGVYVDDIVPASGAARSDLKAGDVVVGLNGKDIFTRPDLLAQVRTCKPGEIIRLKVRRGEVFLTIPLTVGKKPS